MNGYASLAVLPPRKKYPIGRFDTYAMPLENPILRGIGVRIEHDVLVTNRGCNNLSGRIPADAADVEAWIRGIWKS